MPTPKDIIKCCMTCKYLAYSSCSTNRAYCIGQKDAPHIVCPDKHSCDRYTTFIPEPKEKEPTQENKMDADSIKDVTKKVFDRDFWIPGDIYVMENTKDDIRFMCVLIKFEKGDTRIRVWVNGQDYVVFWSEQIGETYKVVKHITQKSLIED